MTRFTPNRPGSLSSRPQRILASLTVVALALLGVVAGAAPANASTDVSGRLVDQLGHPVLGLEFRLSDTQGNLVPEVSSATDGTFTLPALDDGSYYLILGENPVTGTYTDINGDHYENNGSVSFFVPQTTDLGDIVMNKFVPISGTITNWTPDMGDIRVDLFGDSGGQWHQMGNGGSYGVDTTTAQFSFTAPISAIDYTLRFQIEGTGPYLDAFLGGELDDPALGSRLDGVPGVGQSGIQMTMPAAAIVTGRVTTGGGTTPLEGIDVSAQNEPDETYFDQTITDADGQYSLRVRPGVDNEVQADDFPAQRYLAMTYNGHDGCGCIFDPVVSQVGSPAQNIDFDLVANRSPELQGLVIDAQTNDLYSDLDVKLFRAVGATWVLADETTSITGNVPNYGFVLNGAGHYRVQFAAAGGRILMITDGYSVPGLDVPVTLDPLPGCYADLGTVDASDALETTVDPSTPAGACTVLAVASGTTSGSTSGSTKHPHHSGIPTFTAPFPTSAPSATPTPTATPTPSETPQASGDAPVPAQHKPAAAPDLWWLLGLGLGILLVIIVGGGIFLFRRA